MNPYNYLQYLLTKNKKPMDKKQEALNRLDAIEKEAESLRQIILAPDVKKPIMERIKTVEDAIDDLGEGDEFVKEYRKMQKADLGIATLTHQRIKIWAKCLNEDHKFDWNNTNEYKYLPWFDLRKSVNNGFFDSDYAYWYYCSSGVSACLFYKSKELALYSGKQIEQEYFNMMMK